MSSKPIDRSRFAVGFFRRRVLRNDPRRCHAQRSAAKGLDEFLSTVDWTAVDDDGTIYGERDDDGDTILNAYDYSPLGTFDLHYVEDGVITTFADGSPQYPFPIHNIWQLQAISGEDRAPSHLTSGTFATNFSAMPPGA